jgi:hypothetical protein
MEFTKEQIRIIRAALGWHSDRIGKELKNIRGCTNPNQLDSALIVEKEIQGEFNTLDSLMEHFAAIAK